MNSEEETIIEYSELAKIHAQTDELVRCLERAIKFVYLTYGENSEALADMETVTWRAIVKDVKDRKQRDLP